MRVYSCGQRKSTVHCGRGGLETFDILVARYHGDMQERLKTLRLDCLGGNMELTAKIARVVATQHKCLQRLACLGKRSLKMRAKKTRIGPSGPRAAQGKKKGGRSSALL